jgi:Bacterial protein of unknown function (DUF899)
MTERKTATREEWLTARAELLTREKELTRMSDELARQRQELPWVPVEKKYTFQTADGSKTLAELFEGRSQLAVYHFMFGPSYETACTSCSSIAKSNTGCPTERQDRARARGPASAECPGQKVNALPAVHRTDEASPAPRLAPTALRPVRDRSSDQWRPTL